MTSAPLGTPPKTERRWALVVLNPMCSHAGSPTRHHERPRRPDCGQHIPKMAPRRDQGVSQDGRDQDVSQLPETP
eukprot:7250483-Pyramimonas_sp.AAC.1